MQCVLDDIFSLGEQLSFYEFLRHSVATINKFINIGLIEILF